MEIPIPARIRNIADTNGLGLCFTIPLDRWTIPLPGSSFPGAVVNPLGDWTGGTDVDTGAANRKLGSDMADSVTGGGLHGKDLSKADVSVNIYAWLKAQETGKPVEFCCAIGDAFPLGGKNTTVTGNYAIVTVDDDWIDKTELPERRTDLIDLIRAVCTSGEAGIVYWQTDYPH